MNKENETIFWLSFCDPDKPKGQRFLGVAIIEAFDLIDAVQKAHRLGINPGGKIKSWELVKDIPNFNKVCNRLLNKAELQEFGLIEN